MAQCRDKDTGGSSSGEYSLACALLEAAIFSPRPGPTQQPIGSSAWMPQTKQPRGQEHSPTHQHKLPKDFQSPQPPLNMPLDMAIPTRGPRSSSTHQWADTRNKQTTIQQPVEPSLQKQFRTYPGNSWSLALGWEGQSPGCDECRRKSPVLGSSSKLPITHGETLCKCQPSLDLCLPLYNGAGNRQ